LPTDSVSTLGWFRLRYAFTPRPRFQVEPALGVVQVAKIMIGAFEIRMTASKNAMPGQRYPVRVKIDDPATGRAIAGITVEFALDIDDDDDHIIKRKVTTDAAGYAVTTFDLPKTVTESDGTVTATARRGQFTEKASVEFDFPERARVVLTTDKPLYQPGQTAHMRVLAFGPDKRTLADAQVEFTIETEDGDEQFKSKAVTSRFGVATADWDIPNKLQLGEFKITAEVSTKDTTTGDNSNQPVRVADVHRKREPGPHILPARTGCGHRDKGRLPFWQIAAAREGSSCAPGESTLGLRNAEVGRRRERCR
jgi:hypothetical protein